MNKLYIVAALGAFGAMSAMAAPCVSLVDASFTTATYDQDSPSVGTGTWTGTTCSVNGLTFSNFAVFGQAYGASGPGIQVTFTVVGNGLQIGTTNLGTNDIEIYYTISPGVTGIGLSGGPGENVTEEVCGVAYNQSSGTETCGTPLNQSNLALVNGNPSQVNSVVTAAPIDYIVKDDSGGSQITQTFVPEPMSLSLMGAGLLGLGLLGRKIRK